mgnify:CR=1 FL=1
MARYTSVARLLHWIIAILILVNLWLGFAHDSLPKDWKVMPVHKSIGLTVLALTILRIVWRLGHKPPALPAAMPGWEKLAANLTKTAGAMVENEIEDHRILLDDGLNIDVFTVVKSGGDATLSGTTTSRLKISAIICRHSAERAKPPVAIMRLVGPTSSSSAGATEAAGIVFARLAISRIVELPSISTRTWLPSLPRMRTCVSPPIAPVRLTATPGTSRSTSVASSTARSPRAARRSHTISG